MTALSTAKVQDPVFAQDPEAVLASLEATTSGLTVAEAAARLATVGPNRLPAPPRQHPVLRFLGHFDDVLIYILLAAAVLKALLGDWVDFAVILAVALVNALVGFIQEGRAETALAGLSTMLSLDAHTLRDGEWRELDSQDLVPGDVVRVRSGDKVPADVRLVEATTLQVEEAALTGESVASAKSVEAVGADAGIGDRSCMLFSGTIVTAGRGLGVVTATGGQTEIGRIQQLVAGVDHLETPLTRQLARLGKQLSWLILGLAALMLVIGRLIHQFALDELVSAAIGFAVAAVPEGLPALVTITLALGVQQMARQHAITRKLTSVEGLGSVTTICSDKTGTLTRNEMTARTVVTLESTYQVDGIGYAPDGAVLVDGGPAALERHADLRALVDVAALVPDAQLARDGDAWVLVGQPTEGAMVVLARKAGAGVEGVTRRGAVPFESATKYSATLDELPDGTRRVHVMGAPDRLLDRCTTQRSVGGTAALDRSFWDSVVDELGAQGLRVLAAARRPARADDEVAFEEVGHDLEFLGVVGIVDPPRPEAIQAIADCHRGASGSR